MGKSRRMRNHRQPAKMKPTPVAAINAPYPARSPAIVKPAAQVPLARAALLPQYRSFHWMTQTEGGHVLSFFLRFLHSETTIPTSVHNPKAERAPVHRRCTTHVPRRKQKGKDENDHQNRMKLRPRTNGKVGTRPV